MSLRALLSFLTFVCLSSSLLANADEVPSCRNQKKNQLQNQAALLAQGDQPRDLAAARRIFADYKRLINDKAEEFITNPEANHVLLFVHSFTQTPAEVLAFAGLYTKLGYNVLAIGYEGHEYVDGKQTGCRMGTFDENLLVADVQFAKNLARHYGKAIHLMGYSLGGMLSLQQLFRDRSGIRTVALVAPALDTYQDDGWIELGGRFSCTAWLGLGAVRDHLPNLVDTYLPHMKQMADKVGLDGLAALPCLLKRLRQSVFFPTMIEQRNPEYVFGRQSMPLLLVTSDRDHFVNNATALTVFQSWGTRDRALFHLGPNDVHDHTNILQPWTLEQPRKADCLTLQEAIADFAGSWAQTGSLKQTPEGLARCRRDSL